ncbi:unnamed protein product [Sphagnum troendelagicum]|uniref:Uncharacterized protein n=1 Tax=Sphagnum troendelagicum TaxID=128251 RepID=A0ABP0TG90_9BRYO
MKTEKLAVIVLLLSSCLLASGNVFVHISTLTVATLVDVHTRIAKANLADGQQVMLADQLGGPGVVGYDFSTVIGQHFNVIFGPT